MENKNNATEEFLKKYQNVKNSKYVKIVGSYYKCYMKIKCICLICGETFYISPDNLMRGCIHNNCAISMGRTSNTQKFKEKLAKINSEVDVVGEYINAKTKIKCMCKLCSNMFECTPNNLLGGQACPLCHNYKIIHKNNKNIDNLLSNIYEKFSDFEFIEIPSNRKQKVLCQCNLCDNQWKTNLQNLFALSTKYACLNCNKIMKYSQEIDELAKKLNITVKYENILNRDEKIYCQCNTCGYAWNSKLAHLRQMKYCKNCINKRKLTHEEFIEQIKKLNPNVDILSKYINSNTKILCHCKLCDTTYYTLPRDAKNGICQGCASIKMRKLFAKTTKEFENDIKELYGDEYQVEGEYVNCRTSISIKHILCENSFLFTPNNIYNDNKQICPFCYDKNSVGERCIQHFLNSNNIQYQIHKTFPGLCGKRNGKLSYDFYLKDYNILIEFQGIQHYQPINKFGGEEKFKIQQEHDRRKREYAEKNDMVLLEIRYDEIDNIDEILHQQLNIIDLVS